MRTPVVAMLALLVLSGSAAAQGDIIASATANVGLEVVPGLTITNTSDIQFGNIAPGQETVTLAKNATITSTGNGGAITNANGTVGEFHVTGFAGSTFTVDAANVVLTGSNGGSITFTPTLYHGSQPADGANAAPVSGDVTLIGSSHYLYVGGTVNVPAGQTVGTYTGTLTVTVAYTSL